jgi:hypothetical protein
MNNEEDEFRRIEAEALRLWAAQTDDDDTQIYLKPWIGLTDEQIHFYALQHKTLVNAYYDKAKDTNITIDKFDTLGFARAIEKTLKEKNT